MSVLTAIRRGAAVASLATVPLLGATSALADSPAGSTEGSTGSSAAAPAGPRLARACERLPLRIERLEKVRARLHAGADTRGSIAFLSARIDQAKAAGHADLARLLADRLAVRKDIDSQLPDVLASLKDAQQVCAQRPEPTRTSA